MKHELRLRVVLADGSEATATFRWMKNELAVHESDDRLDFMRFTRNAEETKKYMNKRHMKYSWEMQPIPEKESPPKWIKDRFSRLEIREDKTCP